MTQDILVTDQGFSADDWTSDVLALADLVANDDRPALAVDLGPADEPADLSGLLDRITLIRVAFPAFSDGRGFTIARQLRRMGYRGRLRAAGHVIADQYAMARRAGFDEIQIDPALAARQPEDQWRARSDWNAHDYQARLRG